MPNNPYTEEQELAILKNLLQAMKNGEIESLTYKRKRKGSKEFFCEVNHRPELIIHSASSTQGVHDLGVLFTSTLARAGLGPDKV